MCVFISQLCRDSGRPEEGMGSAGAGATVTVSCPTRVLRLSPLGNNPAILSAKLSSRLKMLISIYVA